MRRKKKRTWVGPHDFADEHQPCRMSWRGSPTEDPLNLEEDQWCGVAEVTEYSTGGIFSKRDVPTAQRLEIRRPEKGLNFLAGRV